MVTAGDSTMGDVPCFVDGEPTAARGGQWLDKLSPVTGRVIGRLTRAGEDDVSRAVASAARAQPAWAATPAVRRGEILHAWAGAMAARRDEIAALVALETGKSHRDALGETDGAIALGRFMAGEGQRLYGRTTTSGAPNKHAMTIREPIGVAGLIVAANTPIANVAWKAFPALICGNAAVLKAAEDTPATAHLFARIGHDAGVPPGVLNVIQGLGAEVGRPLVAHPQVSVLSFTGSTAVGREIGEAGARRLARVSLELGGKNPLVVCDDADLDNAVRWTLLSAFSNAGQRCAAASRVIVMRGVYDEFRERLVARTRALRVGPADDHDLGPVISARALDRMVSMVERAVGDGATLLTGGGRLAGPELADPSHAGGFFMAPTLLEGAPPASPISREELFGPVACIYPVADFAEALALANDSDYGLTASIHTRSVHRALTFTRVVHAGVAVVNAGTFGSEPHMPFGGVKQSGNGSREPGTEALDVYSNLKDVYFVLDPTQL